MSDEKRESRADAEAPSSADGNESLTRRNFLGRSAATAVTVTLLSGSAAHASRMLGARTAIAEAASASGVLTAAEMTTLEAVLAQLLPKDDLGPGAVEAGVPTYIDTALAGSYKPLLPVYQSLLPMFDRSAAAMGASSFAELSPSKQIALLSDFEAGKPPGVAASGAASAADGFQLLLAHMREGMFADPMYGGNVDLAGWKLMDFPDIQLKPSAHDQAIGTVVKPTGETAQTLGGSPYNGPYADA